MIGERFGRWTVLERVDGYKKNNRYTCRCDCGDSFTLLGFTLRSGASKQCKKCYKNRSHGKSKTPTYKIWSGLFTRCYNQNHRTYKHYGAKGITVSDDWHSFDNFFSDMGERPIDYQIDRIDNTKGYNKYNCRWISKHANTSRQNNRLINITGMKFGKWTVIDRDMTKLGHDVAYWNCVCECGYESSLIGSMLRHGKTKQCLDCKHKEHGEIHSGWSKRKFKIEMRS